jgi:hypothetical protein
MANERKRQEIRRVVAIPKLRIRCLRELRRAGQNIQNMLLFFRRIVTSAARRHFGCCSGGAHTAPARQETFQHNPHELGPPGSRIKVSNMSVRILGTVLHKTLDSGPYLNLTSVLKSINSVIVTFLTFYYCNIKIVVLVTANICIADSLNIASRHWNM